jgi:serine/threonine protein phosphatase PrpC
MEKQVDAELYSVQGERETNEDAEACLLNINNEDGVITPKDPKKAPVDIFIICDGHGGDAVSTMIAPLLLNLICHKTNTFPLSSEKIKNIYDDVHNRILKKYPVIARECGSTALVLVRYFKNNKEYVQILNTGDCRALLSRRGIPIQLTKDHRPVSYGETRRIELVNKTLKKSEVKEIEFCQGEWRIDGYSVSRAFGDFDVIPHITYYPESFIYEINLDDEYIVMACDGLWEVMSNQNVVDFVDNHINDNRRYYWLTPGDKKQEAEIKDLIFNGERPNVFPYPDLKVLKTNNFADLLCNYAVLSGSSDNVSVIIIYFG